MIMERLATKVAIEAKAAMSRIRSVIIVSLSSLCFHFVLFAFASQQKNRTETSVLDILVPLVNKSLMHWPNGEQTPPLAILGVSKSLERSRCRTGR
jgi:hypothetical protein